MDRIVLFGQLAAGLDELNTRKAQAFLLEALQDGPDEAAMHRVWFEQDQRTLHGDSGKRGRCCFRIGYESKPNPAQQCHRSITGTVAIKSCTTSATRLPSTSASGRRIKRCPSTPSATACTSSCVKKCLPSSMARPRAQRSKQRAARGLAPSARSGCSRL